MPHALSNSMPADLRDLPADLRDVCHALRRYLHPGVSELASPLSL
jgi:hypothetical protein